LAECSEVEKELARTSAKLLAILLPTKIGGKRFALAATGIDFNRILLSA
jgi:hypothetical protein